MASPKSKKPPAPKPSVSAASCAHCATLFPSGPREFTADCHMVDGTMIATCSKACRAALGLKERKSECRGPFADLFD